MRKRILIWAGAALLVLASAAGLLYFFGGMQPPTAAAKAAYAAEVAAGAQPAIQARFTIPVPGCVCHTTDPVLQMQHSNRRMSECGGCHSRG
jgi:hypothetical protein